MNRINPSLASGFRDYLPSAMIPRQRMLDIIRREFERFGFVPLDTPGLEREEILTGGDPNFSKQIYRASLRKGSAELALRFDLTVPLARVVALYNNEIDRPFKRYQVGKVWRGERAQAGRFREFIQFDADIVGSESMMADSEIVALMHSTLEALGVQNFLIRVNNRKILNGLPAYAGFAEDKIKVVLRTVDKLDKQGWNAVREELLGDEIGLTSAQADAIRAFIEVWADTPQELLKEARTLMSNSEIALEGIGELEEVCAHVEALGVPAGKWTVDLSVARGIGYYTGPVFETILPDLPSIGSVFSGGRYDDLVTRFSPDTVPATGASVGVDRLFAALEQLGQIKAQKTVSRVLILNFDPGQTLICEKIGGQLRNGGIPTEIYFGKEATIKGQLTYATKQDVPVVILIGGNEASRGVVAIKDMVKRQQIEVPYAEALTKVQEILRL